MKRQCGELTVSIDKTVVIADNHLSGDCEKIATISRFLKY